MQSYSVMRYLLRTMKRFCNLLIFNHCIFLKYEKVLLKHYDGKKNIGTLSQRTYINIL